MMDRDRKIEKIRELLSDCENMDHAMDHAIEARKQSLKIIEYTPLEEMDSRSLQSLFNALDHCGSR